MRLRDPFTMLALALTTLVLALAGAAAYGQNAAPDTPPMKWSGLAATPPMGWNSWNKFGCDINEQLIRETADALVATGLRDAGYQYVNIDDCWQGTRDAKGFMRPDPLRFPSGMKALADYVHSKGLKFGLYSDAGWKTCGGRPGSRGYEFQDALTYAEWGVDYLKYDWCFTEGLKAEGAYQTMSAALRQAGRPIVFSLCEWGGSQPWVWAKDVGHAWRTTGDIHNCFDCVHDHGSWKAFGAMQILDMQHGLRGHAGPGRWNDADMLQVGNGMTAGQNRAHFTMWAMLASPLIAGNDVRKMDKETLAVLANKGVIALNQDSLGVAGWRQATRDGVELWWKPLAGGDWAFVALNREKAPRALTLDWAAEAINDAVSGRDTDFKRRRYAIADLWRNNAAAGDTTRPLQATVPAQDVLALRLQLQR